MSQSEERADAIERQPDRQQPQAPTSRSTDERTIKQLRKTLNGAVIVSASFFIGIAGLMIWIWRSLSTSTSLSIDAVATAILPLVIAAITVLVTVTGFNRLKNFDDRQDAMRKDLKEELTAMMPWLVKTQAATEIDELRSETESAMDEISQALTAFRLEIDQLNRSNPWLREVGTGNVDWEQLNATVSWVHDFVLRRFDEMADKQEQDGRAVMAAFGVMKSAIEAVCKEHSKISGDHDDYHNLASVLAKNNQYEMAAQVVKKGWSLFPHNTDLMADLLFYEAKAHGPKFNTEEIDSLVPIEKRSYAEIALLHIPRNQWNWRAYAFYIEVLSMRPHSAPQRIETMAIADAYIACLPFEERAYFAKYETLEAYGDHEAAIEVLEEAEKVLSMTAQCSLRLAEVYKMRGEFNKAIRSASRAIIGQAEDQPSSNQAAAYAERAFARDAKIQTRLLGELAESEADREQIHGAIRDYEAAISLKHPLPDQLRKRILMLRQLLPSTSPDDEQPDLDPGDGQSAFTQFVQELLQALDGDQSKVASLVQGLHEYLPITEGNESDCITFITETTAADETVVARILQIIRSHFS